jgi:chromosome segregation ATPase
MKAIKWIVAIAAISMVVACGQQDTATPAKEEVASSASDMQQESKNRVDAVQDYSMEQKELLQQQARDHISNLSDKISHLQNKSENAAEEVKADVKEATADLTSKLETAKAQLRQIQNATADTWESVKGDLSAALQNVENAYNKAVSRLQ